MGKEKSVEKIDEKSLEESLNILKNIKGHYMSFHISTEQQEDSTWKAEGKMKVGSTLDGEHWGEMEMGVMGYDVNSDSALATVMVSLNNYINSPEFIVEMAEKIHKSSEEEAKLPESLDK